MMSPLRGGSQTGYHGAGDKGGEASTNIMSALRCNKTLYSNNNSDQYFQRDIYNILQARLVNSHRDLRQSVESPLGRSPGDHCHPDWSPWRPHHLQSTQF